MQTADRPADQTPGLPSGIPKERVAGLFDGIVAITATLLTLEFAVPDSGGPLTADLLVTTGKSVIHWAISFIMVAVIWNEFHFVFAHSRRWDSGLLLVTFGQMALISLVPFAAELVGENPTSLIAALIFSGIMGANGLLVSANIYVLQRKDHLHAFECAHAALARRRRAQMLIYPACLVISVTAAILHDPIIGILVWALCPLALAGHVRHAARTSVTPQPNSEVAI
ncbi:TMEM175 family protein [Roseisalinus antarcticus]|uniref:DUF1211 domain-containing protein n=1 Tax=Roseisalinus antarcticus TaxID=254357 RepID=A0A1Y5T052_9RHOB|nr:TMEM175 family protein [Roseisalinus antarcticus]SLN52118.1 hypothetical protein ROA7023_02300 [Roseisalinus antarcticus]